MINGNDPAMPIQYEEEVGNHGRMINRVFEGLTKRELFAAMCLQGMMANPKLYEIIDGKLDPNDYPEFYSTAAVEHADALINELNK